MYRRFLKPTYYSCDYGGVHLVALDTVDIEDQWYYAHVDAIQRNCPLALGGHGHAREEILLGDRRFTTRFHQTSAVVGDAGEREGMEYVSGVTLYNFHDGAIEGWEFIPVDRLDRTSGSVDSPR